MKQPDNCRLTVRAYPAPGPAFAQTTSQEGAKALNAIASLPSELLPQ